MNIKIQGTQLELTPAIKKFVEEKLDSVERLISGIDAERSAQVNVQIERITRHHRHGNVLRAEINLRLPGKLIRAEAADDDIRVAIRIAAEELISEVKKYKGRFMARRRMARKVKGGRMA